MTDIKKVHDDFIWLSPQTIDNIECGKCGKYRKVEVRLVVGKDSICKEFDIG